MRSKVLVELDIFTFTSAVTRWNGKVSSWRSIERAIKIFTKETMSLSKNVRYEWYHNDHNRYHEMLK
jgi:hypothetical protein